MDKLVDHLLVFEGDGIVRDFPGNYSEYRLTSEEDMAKLGSNSVSEKPVSNSAYSSNDILKKKPSFKEKREFELLDKEIKDLHREKEELTEKLSTGSLPFAELQKLSARIAEISSQADEKEMRWLELSELVES